MALPLLLSFALSVSSKSVDYLPQSFFFDYNKASEPFPVPTTQQCETIHVSWSRGSTNVGPNPVAPYSLMVYTSNFVFPFVIPAGNGPSFDWQVPFAPGTRYQICMFDKDGNSGGCQDMYTVIPASSTPSCSNATFPLGPLEVEAVQNTGPISQYGWIDQCTDIAVTPKNGTPPYKLTIAPTLHPVWNLTINDNSQTNWTVALSWASSFFISVTDSAGNFWSNGPLHSGQGTTTKCLSTEDDDDKSFAIPVGAGVGGLVVGLLAGIGAAVFFMRRRSKSRYHLTHAEPASPFVGSYRANSDIYTDSPHGLQPSSSASSGRPLLDNRASSHSVMLSQMSGDEYHIEPFNMPGTPNSPMATSSAAENDGSQSNKSRRNQVYVVHHDGGRAPVTVYHGDGTEVVELPPQYHGDEGEGSGASNQRHNEPHPNREGRSASGSEPSPTGENTPGSSAFLQQQRRPDRIAKKSPTHSSRLEPPSR